MKRYLLPLVIVLVPLAATILWVWTPRTVPSERVSDLYRRYEHNPHLTVAYIEDFPVNDTVAVDVTILTATDDEGWDTLKKDFNVKPIPDIMQEELDNGRDIIVVRLAPKSDPTKPMDTTDIENNNIIGISNLKHSISIFNTDTESQQDAVTHYNYRKS